ncbi:MAG: hypothetical protein IT204_15145 [Fimbriimonadaceae bacterium]|nr:hypothetical protein [Fimbriimonadaceae bacterium]
MTPSRLAELLARFRTLTIAVVGDYFVDEYRLIDPDLEEPSLETGLPAHQVVQVRYQPGAAGTVTNNLAALGVQAILAVGCTGSDGLGWELRRGLASTGVDLRWLLEWPDRVTPTYTKPLVLSATGPRELSRLDIKNRVATPTELQDGLIVAIEEAAALADGMLLLDQVSEPQHGVLTSRVRNACAELARARGDWPLSADSRAQIAAFQAVTLKPNRAELAALTGWTGELADHARQLAHRQGRPCFVTLGDQGVVVADGDAVTTVPAVPVTGPVDIVGAGDSFHAAAGATLAAGGTAVEAAQVGCLVASLTVQQIGTTGTARPDEVLARLAAAPW